MEHCKSQQENLLSFWQQSTVDIFDPIQRQEDLQQFIFQVSVVEGRKPPVKNIQKLINVVREGIH